MHVKQLAMLIEEMIESGGISFKNIASIINQIIQDEGIDTT